MTGEIGRSSGLVTAQQVVGLRVSGIEILIEFGEIVVSPGRDGWSALASTG